MWRSFWAKKFPIRIKYNVAGIFLRFCQPFPICQKAILCPATRPRDLWCCKSVPLTRDGPRKTPASFVSICRPAISVCMCFGYCRLLPKISAMWKGSLHRVCLRACNIAGCVCYSVLCAGHFCSNRPPLSHYHSQCTCPSPPPKSYLLFFVKSIRVID